MPDIDDMTAPQTPAFDENTPPRGDEEYVNVLDEESDEVAPAKDQSAVLDDEPVELDDTPDENDEILEGPAEQGA